VKLYFAIRQVIKRIVQCTEMRIIYISVIYEVDVSIKFAE